MNKRDKDKAILSPGIDCIYPNETGEGLEIIFKPFKNGKTADTVANIRVLGEIFEGCDALALPPLTSVVARQAEVEHGLPGPGYFRALAASENRA